MDDLLNQAKKDEANCEKIRRAHYIAWEKQSKRNLVLGLLVVFLTATTGTTIYSSFQFSAVIWLPIIAGIISFLATILSALQTFLKPSEQAEAHKAAAARFASMKREFRLFHLEYSGKDNSIRDQAIKDLKELNSKLDFYAENCVAIPDAAMLSAQKELARTAS